MPERPPPLYPLRFKEIFKDKIWGGPELAKVAGKKGAGRRCGESWEIAQRDKARSLDQRLEQHRKAVLGDEHSMRFKRYPLLVKFICAHERLSLQVHPTDDYAQRYESE